MRGSRGSALGDLLSLAGQGPFCLSAMPTLPRHGPSDESSQEFRYGSYVPHLTVSRLQMIVYRSGQALDMRSLNGTIVNGRFLRYSFDYYLKDKDIVALLSAFRVSLIGPTYLPFVAPAAPSVQLPPSDAWGVLIDGRARTTTPITKARLFLD
jgi:pSer/pThr/pTyr-binding forkhead associated (FHA) protein